jgi:hypothetical protein
VTTPFTLRLTRRGERAEAAVYFKDTPIFANVSETGPAFDEAQFIKSSKEVLGYWLETRIQRMMDAEVVRG